MIFADLSCLFSFTEDVGLGLTAFHAKVKISQGAQRRGRIDIGMAVRICYEVHMNSIFVVESSNAS